MHSSVARALRISLTAVSLCLLHASAAKVVCVDKNAPGPAHDGASWATAFTTVQAGVNAAVAGDEVWVAAATYMENITLTAGTGLYGGFKSTETARDQRDWRANTTVLDGNQRGNVVVVPPGAPRSTVLDGFTAQHGNGNITPVTVPEMYGSGLYIGDASPTISHNVFRDNVGRNESGTLLGGGVYVWGGEPSIRGNQLLNNTGSGVEAHWATVDLRENLAVGNGYGFSFSSCDLAVVNNTVEWNSGAGVRQLAASTGWIANNVVTSNGSYGIDDLYGPVVSHNCAYGNGGSDFRRGDEWPMTNGNIRVNPRLRNDGVRLRPDSPCVDAGDSSLLEPGETDAEGQPRIQGPRVDIGADEFDFSYTLPPPPPVVHVRPDGNDDNDGSTWVKAKRTIAGAVLDLETVRGEVWATAGSYGGRLDLGSRTSIYGGFKGTETAREPREPSANETIISDGSVQVPSGAATALDGVTLTDGGIKSQAASLSASRVLFGKGGIQQVGGTLAVTDCVFGAQDNRGPGITARSASVTIARNTIRQRRAGGFSTHPTASIDFSGGAVNLYGCNGTVTENVISDNGNSSWSAATAYGGGAGLFSRDSTLFITRNVITDNTVSMYGDDYGYPMGGGILGDGGTLLIADNLIAGNTLQGDGLYTGESGAGVYLREGSAILVNNTIVGNSASGSGYGNEVRGGGVEFVTLAPPGGYQAANNIIAFNDTGVDWYGTALAWSHNDVFGNGQDYPKDGPDLTGVSGNIKVDPLFVDRGQGDYHLQPLSPCIDAGDDLAVVGTYDLDGRFRLQGPHVDLGAYEQPVTSLLTMADVARALRFAAGISSASVTDVWRLDHVWPGHIDLLDAVRIARKAAGLEANP